MKTQYFDNFKKENKDNLDSALVSLCRKNGWYQTDEDWLGIIADNKYYCLGDPSAPIKEIIETKKKFLIYVGMMMMTTLRLMNLID